MGIENPVHLLFIAIVALVVLGPKRLPEVAKALGHGIREFREAVSTSATQPPPAAAPVAPPPAPAPPASPPAGEPPASPPGEDGLQAAQPGAEQLPGEG